MKLSIFSCLILICLTSCSSKVALSYSPVIEMQSEKHIAMKVHNFADNRPTKKPQQVGALRNGFGMPLIKLTTDENVPLWISNAIKIELKNAGYKIAGAEENAFYTVEGKILKTFAHSYLLYHGTVSVDLALKKEDQIIFQKIYTSDKNNGLNWAGQASSCVKGLEYNLQQICQKFISDVNKSVLADSQSRLIKE